LLTEAEAAERPRDYLQAELSERLAREPVEFRLTLQLAHPDDTLDDPTVAWPADRPTITAGHLELTEVIAHGECEARIFDPGNVVDGVEPSGDPILAIRSHAYGVSYARRQVAS
jgi:catalase